MTHARAAANTRRPIDASTHDRPPPRPVRLLALFALVGLAACATPPEHEATGFVVSVDPVGKTATIRHLDIPGVMGGMTMRFPVQSPGVVAGVMPRDFVHFVLRERDGKLIVVRMAATAPPEAKAPEGSVPGLHDHSPRHGGIVGMSGQLHLEALARGDGTVLVYLTDYNRAPRPLDDVSGTVTLELPAGDRELALRATAEALEAKGEPVTDAEVSAHVALKVAGEPVEMDFVLPIAGAATGAAGVPPEGCAPVPPEPGKCTPRCAIDFGRAVTALATTQDGATLLVAAVDVGISAWRLPEGTFLHGFEPPPPIDVPDVRMMKPHPEGANAIAIRPDGREAVVALENRLLVYDVPTGKLARELPPASNVVRDVAWSPDGKSLLVTIFYDANARLLRPENGIEWGRLPVEREASAAAFSNDGRVAAVGGETGALVLFTLSGGEPRMLGEGRRAIAALAFDGERLVAGHDGGIVQIWSVPTGTLEREVETRSPTARVAARGGRVAMTGRGGTWELLAPGRGENTENCQWHRQEVGALAWSGATLITADSSGRVGLFGR